MLKHHIKECGLNFFFVLWQIVRVRMKPKRVMKLLCEWHKRKKEELVTVRRGAAGNTLRADDGHPTFHEYQGELSQLCKEQTRQAGLSKQEGILIKVLRCVLADRPLYIEQGSIRLEGIGRHVLLNMFLLKFYLHVYIRVPPQ